MSKIDSTGVTPGLAPKAEVAEKVLSLKCKNTSYACESMDATEISLGEKSHVGHRLYRCVKCGFSWSVAVGGSIVL